MGVVSPAMTTSDLQWQTSFESSAARALSIAEDFEKRGGSAAHLVGMLAGLIAMEDDALANQAIDAMSDIARRQRP